MRRILALTLALALWAFGALVVVSRAAPNCTEVGTPDRDIVAGTSHRDIICLKGGDDYSHGDGGSDIVRGEGGGDALVGGDGRDRLLGGSGSDRLFSIDQHRGNDVIRGGDGDDQCFADVGDKVFGCEKMHRVHSSKAADATIAALEIAFYGMTVLGEQFQEAMIPGLPGPPGPPGSPGPPGPGNQLPACPPNADSTPPPCEGR